MTVYENAVSTDPKIKSNAMILPCPFNEGDDEIRLFNLEHYPFLFKDCEECFPIIKDITHEGSRSKNKSEKLSPRSSKLEVVDVGGYKVSIGKSLEDLLKIDTSVFTLPKNISEILSKNYSKGFAFIICAFSNKDIKSHPIAFKSSKFSKTELFVPTRHAHGGEDEKESEKAGWNHIIYSFNTKHGVSMINELKEADLKKKTMKIIMLSFQVKLQKIFLKN